MGYETQPSPRNSVSKHYGAVTIHAAGGVEHTKTKKHRYTVEVTVDTIADGFISVSKLPKGAYITGAYAEVTEAFALTGTTPTIRLRDSATVANYVEASEAQAEAIGTYDIISSAAGDWDSTGNGLDAISGTLEVVLGGTTPATSGTAGKILISLEYINLA